MAIDKALIIAEAQTKLAQANSLKSLEKQAVKEDGRKRKHNQEYLYRALESAEQCVNIIPDEELRVMNAVKELEGNKFKDKYWKVRIAFLEDNLETMKKTYPIFQEEAKRRRSLIEEVNRRNAWGLEKEKCRYDSHYWFDNYAWTADPRKTGIWALPFLLYPFQRETLDWLEDLIFTKQSSGAIEKSRDLGLSWEISSLLFKHWNFPRDGVFQALIGSITSDECDTIGDPSSVFEKIRIQARLQPLGLLPAGWDCQIPYMKAVHPENGSVIRGETSNADFGRSGRYKVILFDEFSAFEQDTQAMTASSQSSPCKIYNSTARGMGNEFARITHSQTIPVLTLRWQEHPHKSEAWYEYQKLEMNPVQIAQELDIDYNASQPNKVYQDWNEVYHVITQTELMKALPDFRGKNGIQIPIGHKVMMGEDVGQTPEHAHVLLWFVTLREGTKTIDGIDVSGCVLLYREIVLPPHSTPRTAVKVIKEAESIWESKQMYARMLSQEAITEQDIYSQEYALEFTRWTPDYNTGIPRVRDYLEVINHHEPHPFREITRVEQFPDKPSIMGRPTMFIVSEDSQAELMWNQTKQDYICKIPDKDRTDGFYRTRNEFPSYHYPTSELGKDLKKMRPKKIFDDAMDVIRCVATECFAPIGRYTDAEKYELGLPQGLKSSNIEGMPLQDLPMAFIQRQQLKEEYNRKWAESQLPYRERLLKKLTK